MNQAGGEGATITIIDTEKKHPLDNVLLFDNNKEYISNHLGIIRIPDIKSKVLHIHYLSIRNCICSDAIINKTVDIYLNFKRLKTVDLPAKWILKGKKLVPINRNYPSFRKC